MSVLTESQLRKHRWSSQGWIQVLDFNMTRLNDTLLKVSGMLDVDLSSLSDNDVLRYNTSSGKFENVSYGFLTTTTTSTTTSSTTSSTTTAVPWYLAANFNLTAGTESSGDFYSTHEEDDVRHVITEMAATPGYDFDYSFANVPAGWKHVRIDGYYNGNAGHNVKIQAWDWSFSSWTNLTGAADDFPTNTSDQSYTFQINHNNFYSGGQVKLRFVHTSGGVAGHTFNLDYMRLMTTTTTTSSTTSTTSTSSTTTAP